MFIDGDTAALICNVSIIYCLLAFIRWLVFSHQSTASFAADWIVLSVMVICRSRPVLWVVVSFAFNTVSMMVASSAYFTTCLFLPRSVT